MDIPARHGDRFKAKNDISVKGGGVIRKGSDVEGVAVIARGSQIREVDRLIATHKLPDGKSTRASDWTKRAAMANVTDDKGATRKAEVHYYQADGIGKVEFKIKK